MAIIKCTAKLLKEIGIIPTNIPDQPTSICDWHANLLWVNRRKYVLFTNELTLYSFLIYWNKTPRSADFLERFRLGLFRSLLNEELTDAQFEYFLTGHAQAIITKTNNRSVLGSMNDLTLQIKYMLSVSAGLSDAGLSEINRHLNRIPMGAIQYKISIDELRRRLADTHDKL